MAPPPHDTKPSLTGKPLPPPPSANSKPTLYRQPYPHNRKQQLRQRPTTRRICCCCCFWSLLLLLITLLLASLLAIALYLLYHPRPPSFTIPSLRVHRFNLTTNDETSSARLSSLFNLTLITKNPNSHFTYNYQPFSVLIMTGEIFLGNGTIPAFSSGEKNTTSFRGVVVEARGVEVEEMSTLRKKMKSKRLVLKVVMDTKVEIRIGKLKSKKVGIRVTCGEIKGNLVVKGKGIVMANVDKSKCKVDLRIKIWNWTF